MKLQTHDGEMFFNLQTVTHVHLSADHSQLTVHFFNDTRWGVEARTDAERGFAAEFLMRLTDEQSGFLPLGTEMLNLKSALWVAIPSEGPVQVRSADNRTRTLEGLNPSGVRRVIGG
jgi:hypothetical protein